MAYEFSLNKLIDLNQKFRIFETQSVQTLEAENIHRYFSVRRTF